VVNIKIIKENFMDQTKNEFQFKLNEINQIVLSKNELEVKCKLIYHCIENFKPLLFLLNGYKLSNEDKLLEYCNYLKCTLIDLGIIKHNIQSFSEDENWSKLIKTTDIYLIFGLCMAIYFEILSVI
jgi:hypothetical protein